MNLDYMTGAEADGGSWTLQTGAETPSYARTFDSYDAFGCTNAHSAQTGLPQDRLVRDLLGLHPVVQHVEHCVPEWRVHGIRLQRALGRSDGRPEACEAGSLSLDIPNYDSQVRRRRHGHQPEIIHGHLRQEPRRHDQPDAGLAVPVHVGLHAP